ncbi:hypothetical protein LQ772_04495 [Frateuria edaphi]|uniref:hypothetical protein n=1 Tax=Frateuria edaphi TaxID=2898793 RepID=UPI001E5C556F|nr:hypothetical protein [Frateuria edaphi]UGB46563.1 hypothetical protein LQ772_04495 [Frateuria edaphi]
MTGKASVLVGFTPFHLLPMREVLPRIEGDTYVFHPDLRGTRTWFREGTVRFLGRCDEPSRQRLAKYFLAGRDIDRLAKKHGKVDVYVPHPYNPLSNHAFFHPRAGDRYVYQDGLLNYYDAMSPLGSWRTRFERKAKAMFAGLRYRTYTGHLSGIESQTISGGFFSHPDRIVMADRFPVLTRIGFQQARPSSGKADGTLFLDQPIEEVVGAELAADLRRKTVAYVNALGGSVYYKPHYAQKLERSLHPAWRVVDADLAAEPAETVVPRLGVSNVVSFFTSALANIAVSCDGVICHATAAHLVPIRVDGRPSTLAELLSAFGVKAVELP